MKKPTPRPQPAPLSYGVSSMGAEGIWRTIKNFLTLSERGNVKPISDITDPPPRPTRASFHRITDRQVEIMTATLCDAILRAGKITPQNVHEAPAHLVGAMITHVKRLNEAVAKASRSPDVEPNAFNAFGQPITLPSAGMPEGSR